MKTNYEVSPEAYDAVNRARELINDIIPVAVGGDIGLAFARINDVIDEVMKVAKSFYESKDSAPNEFFIAYHATQVVLAQLEQQQLAAKAAATLGISGADEA